MPTPSNPMERFAINLVSDPARGAVPMSCENANCENWRNGWAVVLNVQGDVQHAAAGREIEHRSGRRYLKLDPEDAVDWFAIHGAGHGMTLTPRLNELIAATPRGFVLYLFPPGQPCFKRHVDRDVVFAHRGPRGAVRVHERPLDFNEDWNETAYDFERRTQRG